jgi:hypothetical protein
MRLDTVTSGKGQPDEGGFNDWPSPLPGEWASIPKRAGSRLIEFADQPDVCSEAAQPGRAYPPRHAGLGVRQCEIPRYLRRAVGALDRSRAAAAPAGHRCVTTRRLTKPRVRQPHHRRQARRAPGEPLGHCQRRVQHNLRHQVQHSNLMKTGDPGCGNQNVSPTLAHQVQAARIAAEIAALG